MRFRLSARKPSRTATLPLVVQGQTPNPTFERTRCERGCSSFAGVRFPRVPRAPLNVNVDMASFVKRAKRLLPARA